MNQTNSSYFITDIHDTLLYQKHELRERRIHKQPIHLNHILAFHYQAVDESLYLSV